MTFLNPAVLFGLLAAGIPVVIHLLNLRKLKKIEISTLVFLKELQKNKIKQIKLKQWLLLALRVLIILALVTAFARPTIQSLSIGGASTVKTTAIFIIDDSFSMSQLEANGSRFNVARAQVKKHLSAMQEGDDAAVLFTSQASAPLPALSGNLKELVEQVDESGISDISKPLHATVLRAAELLGQSNNFNKELYIISDLQKSRMITDSLYSDLGALLSERVQVYLFPFEDKTPYNLGIDSIQVNTAILQKDKLLSTTLYIKNYSGKPASNTVASLFLNGERAAQKGFTVNERAEVQITLEAVIKTTGFLQITAMLEDDDILSDNKVYASVFVPEKITVGIFEAQPGESRFLRAALQADDSLQSIVTEVKPLFALGSTNLQNYQMLFVVGADSRASYERAAHYVANGGGVFVFPGNNTMIADYQAMQKALGIPVSGGLTEAKGSEPLSEYFSFVDERHPLFTGIFRERGKTGIDSPELQKILPINTGGVGRKLIGLNSGASILTEYRIGKGKVLFMGVAPLLSWGNLPLKGVFIPLVYRGMYYLSASDAAGMNYFAGDEIPVDISRARGKVIQVQKAGRGKESLSDNDGNAEIQRYNKTEVSGNYIVEAAGNIIGVYPVNHHPLESDIENISTDDFADYLNRLHAKAKLHVIKDASRSLEAVKEARFGSELWKWFIIVAFLLAIVESMIARSSKKDIATL